MSEKLIGIEKKGGSNEFQFPLEEWGYAGRGVGINANGIYLDTNFKTNGIYINVSSAYLSPKAKVACSGYYRKDSETTWTAFSVNANATICTGTTAVYVYVISA